MTVLYQSYPKGSEVGQHCHLDENHLVFVVRGSIEYEVNGERQTLHAGDFVFIGKGTNHGFRNASEEESEALVVFEPGGFDVHLDKIVGGASIDDVAKEAGLR